jgi:DNA-binding transcriptional MocR family regulator
MLMLAHKLGDWRGGSGPLYARLADALRAAIQRGDLAAGSRLPSERVLVRRLAVSRTTVVQALALLRDLGLVESVRGSGTSVSRRAGPHWAAGVREAPARSALADHVFRTATEAAADAIGFLAATFPADDTSIAADWRSIADELPELLAGNGYSPTGAPALRDAIAAHCARWGVPTTPEQILVTSGAQQAVHLLAAFFVRAGHAVALEEPTYLGAIDAFAAAGARLVSFPVGPAGLDVELVRRGLTRAAPSLLYVMPTSQNPTGSVLSESTRLALAALAEETGVPIVEDHTLSDLAFGPTPPPIAAFTTRGTVLLVGSMSKVFWGGLRVGWVRGPQPLIERLARLKIACDLGGSAPMHALATRLLRRADEFIASRRRRARAGYEHLAAELARRLPAWTWERPHGGLCLWAQLPSGKSTDFAVVAASHGVAVVPGTAHSPSGDDRGRLRLPFVLPHDQLSEGVARLSRAWAEFTRQSVPAERRLGVVV